MDPKNSDKKQQAPNTQASQPKTASQTVLPTPEKAPLAKPAAPSPAISKMSAGIKVLDPQKPAASQPVNAPPPVKPAAPPEKTPGRQFPIPPPSSLSEATSYAQASMGAINKKSLPSFGQKTPEEPPQANLPPALSVRPIGIFSGFRMRLISLALLIIILFAIGLAASYSDYKYLKPPQAIQKAIDSLIIAAPLPKTPRVIFAKTQAEMAKVKTVTISTEIAAATSNKDFPVKDAKLIIKGPFEFKGQTQTKSQFDISGSVKTEGLSMSAAASVRMIDNYVYFKLNEFPGGAFFNADTFKNKWFYTQIEDNQNKTNQEEFNQKIQKAREVFQNFLTKSHDWTTKTETKDTFDLTVKPPKEEINSLIVDLANVFETKDQTKADKTLLAKNVKDFTDKLKTIEVAVKVRKSDYLISQGQFKISMEMETPNLNSQRSVTLSPNTTLPIDITTTMDFSDFNKPVIVEIPEGAQDFKQYFQSLEKELQKSLGTFGGQNLLQPKPQQSPQSNLNPFDQKSPVLGEKEGIFDLLLRNFAKRGI